jgi:hypothetical protein
LGEAETGDFDAAYEAKGWYGYRHSGRGKRLEEQLIEDEVLAVLEILGFEEDKGAIGKKREPGGEERAPGPSQDCAKWFSGNPRFH